MSVLRSFVRRHTLLAAIIVVLALSVRALVPAGYMTSGTATGFTVTLCGGTEGETVSIALPADPRHHNSDADKASQPCAFAGLGMASLSTIDPWLIAVAIAYVMAIGLRLSVALPPRLRAQFRPPLRGPPAIA